MGLFKRFLGQTRKPEGFFGKLMLNGMNQGHAALSDWGLSHIEGLSPLVVAELGCGGGRNVRELLRRYPMAKVYAVDYSALAVCRTRAYNKPAIVRGRCRVLKASGQSLQRATSRFGLAPGLGAVYFWPDLADCFAEVYRILKCGGSFLICNESDGTDAEGLRYERIIDGMHCYTAEELETMLRTAGFSEVQVFRPETKPWLTVLAKK